MAKESPIRIKGSTSLIELNRYVSFLVHKDFNYWGSLQENVPIKTKKWYRIEWKSVWHDIKGFLKNPFEYAPAIAYSILAFWFIFQKKHSEAIQLAFIGSITLGTPSSSIDSSDRTISYTTATGDILLAGIGIHQGTVNSVTWNGGRMTQGSNAATDFAERAELYYDLAPDIGTYNCIFDGSGGGGRALTVISVAGVSGTGQPDNTGIGTTGSNFSIESDTITPSTNGSLIIDCVYSEATLSSAGSDQTIQSNLQANSYENSGVSTFIQTTAAAKQFTWDLSSGQRWASAIMSFEADGGAPAAGIRSMRQLVGSGQGTRA